MRPVYHITGQKYHNQDSSNLTIGRDQFTHESRSCQDTSWCCNASITPWSGQHCKQKAVFTVPANGNQNMALLTWVKAILIIDEKQILLQKRARDNWEDMNHAHKWQSLSEPSRFVNTPSNLCDTSVHETNFIPLWQPHHFYNNNTCGSQTINHCPFLTDSKRMLLQANSGCTKCHRFWTNHWSRECSFGFPDGLTYHPLMPANVPPRPKGYVPVHQILQWQNNNEFMKTMSSTRQGPTMTMSARSNQTVTTIIKEVDDTNDVMAMIPSSVMRLHYLWPQKLQNCTIPVNLEAI